MKADYAVDLYWLPLGAGGHSVRLNGRVYEGALALWQRRARYDLYHSALEVATPDGRYVIEMAPIPHARGQARGVVVRRPGREPPSRLDAPLPLRGPPLAGWNDPRPRRGGRKPATGEQGRRDRGTHSRCSARSASPRVGS